MKKVLLLGLGLMLLTSCSNEDSQDCNCDKVVGKEFVETINVGSVGLRDIYNITTQNVCDDTDTQEFQYSEIHNSSTISVGDCYDQN